MLLWLHKHLSVCGEVKRKRGICAFEEEKTNNFLELFNNLQEACLKVYLHETPFSAL
jgi:hypothetical protein